MRRFLVLAPLLAAVVALAPAALASEVIHFVSGTTMTIQSHEFKDDMIEINLGRGAVMTFPAYMIERIESAGRDVYASDSYSPTNQALEGEGRSTSPMQQPGLASMPSRFRGGAEARARLTPQQRNEAYQVGLGAASTGSALSPPPEAQGRGARLRSASSVRAAIASGLVGPDDQSRPPTVNTDPRIEELGVRGARAQPRLGGLGRTAPPVDPPPAETSEGSTTDGGGES